LGDDYDLGQFDREAYVTFIREVLRKLPSNCKKKFPDKPLKEILAMSFPENKKLSAKSIKDYCTSYGQFFAWCVEIKKVMSTNPAKGFTIKLDHKSTSRRPYTDDLIAQLLGRFAARISEGGKKREEWKSYLWVFLLGAYQGMRENEACQLFLDDVVSIDGIPALDIHAGDTTQSLKNTPSRRIIPIHPALLSLGFLRFWQERKSMIEREKSQSLNLFLFLPSEVHNYTRNFLYNFTTINEPLTQEGKQTFHCLRHTVSTRLVAAGVSGELVDFIIGHSRPAIFDRYTHLRCRDYLPHLSKMQYAINPAEILHITPCTEDEIKTQTAALPVRG
jgi:integrase